MTEWISQFAPRAQGDGFGDWAHILFLVIIAIFSAIAGLIKNIGAKGKQQTGRGASQKPTVGQPRETWQQRLVRKAEEMQRAAEAKYGQTRQQRPAQPPSGQPQPERQGRLAIRTDTGGESVMVFEKDGPESAARQQAAKARQAREAAVAAGRRAAERRLEMKSRPRPEVATKAVGRQQRLSARTTAEPLREPAGYAAASIIDSSDPDALRKAILHYEILGKPLAWRDPLEHMSRF